MQVSQLQVLTALLGERYTPTDWIARRFGEEKFLLLPAIESRLPACLGCSLIYPTYMETYTDLIKPTRSF